MKWIGSLISAVIWLLVASSVIITTGGLLGHPLLLAAVPTGSMMPALVPSDMIVVVPPWLMPEPRPGQILVYKTPKNSTWIVHRIIDGSAAEGFVTKGDANLAPDPDRIFPKDLAGMVPQWNGSALRLPRLGLLSADQGALSSPVVAIVALIMGIYLVAMDLRPSLKMPRMSTWRPKGQAKPEAVFSMYLGLAGTVFMTTFVPAWSLSTNQINEYEVVAQKRTGHSKDGLYVLGVPHQEATRILNPTYIPVVMVLVSDDPHVRFDPSWALVMGHTDSSFIMTVNNPNIGKHRSGLRTGVFLPLLPPGLLAYLAQRSFALAVLVTALVPTLLVLGLALLDTRNRLVLSRLQIRFVMGVTATR